MIYVGRTIRGGRKERRDRSSCRELRMLVDSAPRGLPRWKAIGARASEQAGFTRLSASCGALRPWVAA